ncbi:MAG: SAM-dependent methyltransferase [Gammaproteobacteria bacterium]|nr:SAM-dependent methyltransferase [Gammaproteobacteria bacterium]
MTAALPEPDNEARAHHAALTEKIRVEIEASGGSIPFARFMELALYAPGFGYYTAGLEKFGASGDFVTAPELGSVFARCLARQAAEILNNVDGGDVLEAGAGSGALAADLLLELERLGQLPGRYFILELGTELRARQATRLRKSVPHLFERVVWLDALPEEFRGVILGNELLDAMPVERFRIDHNGPLQLDIDFSDGQFRWSEAPAGQSLRMRLAPLNLAPGYESEVGFAAEGWVRSAAAALTRGALLLIDYGFPRAEFYHPDRTTGTLMCHYRHRAHGNPLILVGLQDITAHVDFSAVAEAGSEAGLDLLGYTSQAMFLLGCGLDVIVGAMPDDPQSRLSLTNEIKKLTLPHEMGELFKVIALGRGLTTPLRGFAMQDRGGRL